jgi:hypothetical protein
MDERIAPDDGSIQYFGKWERGDGGCSTRWAYSSAYFTFYGKVAAVYARTGPEQGKCEVWLNGTCQAAVDCHAEVEGETCLFGQKGIGGRLPHNLIVRAMGGGRLTITGVAADRPVDFPAELKGQMEAEYAVIQSGQKPWEKSERWKPAAYRANMPEHGVKLLPGMVRDVFDSNINNLKHCFTLPHYCEGGNAPWLTADEMKAGWSGALPASNEGRMLGGAAGVLCWEENADMRAIVDKIIADIKARTRADGYYNYYTEERSYATDHWMHPKKAGEEPNHDGRTSERKNYDRVFWTRGMLAAMRAGNADAPVLLRRMYDWFNRQEQYLTHILVGGNATNGAPGGPLVYNSEIGASDDIVTSMRYFDQDYWLEALAAYQPMAFSHYPGERPHCYDLLPVEAAADQYRATGGWKYYSALMGAWDVYYRYYKHSGGNSAICESSGPYPPGTYYITTGHTGETCGGVFWAWVNERLAQLYPGEEKYIAQIEETIYNTLCNCRDERGYTRYHIHLHGKKDGAANENSCCQVSSTMAISAIPKYIYMADAHTVFVNLFIPSRFDSDFGTLTMETDFPLSGAVAITVRPRRDGERFAVSVRVPLWATGAVTALVNGAAAGSTRAGERIGIDRAWGNGDVISFVIPFGFNLVRYTGADQAEGNPPRYTLLYGPILMALDGAGADSKTIPRLRTTPEKLIASLKPAPGEALRFPVPGTDYTILPYWGASDTGFTCVPIIEE